MTIDLTTIDTTLRFRGADGGAVLPYREHFRTRWPGPTGADGCGMVVIDVDMVLRRYSPTNKAGAFALFEFKYGDGTDMTPGQRITFGQFDRLFSAGDPAGREYRGAYLINWTEGDDGLFKPLKATHARYKNTVLDCPTPDEFDSYFFDLLDPES